MCASAGCVASAFAGSHTRTPTAPAARAHTARAAAHVLPPRYEMGLPPKYHGACEAWATQIKEEVAELFEVISKVITAKFVPAVEAKGELVN
jgi:hypothetical protein